MAKQKTRQYRQITGKSETVMRLHEVRVRLQPKFSVNGFMSDLLDVYERAHCPECGHELPKKTCSCKEPEVC